MHSEERRQEGSTSARCTVRGRVACSSRQIPRGAGGRAREQRMRCAATRCSTLITPRRRTTLSPTRRDAPLHREHRRRQRRPTQPKQPTQPAIATLTTKTPQPSCECAMLSTECRRSPKSDALSDVRGGWAYVRLSCPNLHHGRLPAHHRRTGATLFVSERGQKEAFILPFRPILAPLAAQPRISAYAHASACCASRVQGCLRQADDFDVRSAPSRPRR